MQCNLAGHWGAGVYLVHGLAELMFIHTVVDCPNKRAQDICFTVSFNGPVLRRRYSKLIQCNATGHWATGSYRVNGIIAFEVYIVVDCPQGRGSASQPTPPPSPPRAAPPAGSQAGRPINTCYKAGLNSPVLQ
jgi:hypothetical protein